MSTTTSPRPFLPSDVDPSRSLIRAVTARTLAALRHEDPSAIMRRAWPREIVGLNLVQRSASVPATTTLTGWAAELATSPAAAFVASLAPSAAGRLIASGLSLSLTGRSTLLLPYAASTPSPAWVVEGGAIPVQQGTFADATLGPVRKLAILTSITEEVRDYSPGDAAAVIGTLLRESSRQQLDSALFDSSAASSVRPAGLLHGISAIGVSTAAAAEGGAAAMAADVGAIVDAIVTGGGSGNVAFIASPGRAARMAVLAPGLSLTVLGSAAVPLDRLIGVDVGAFAAAVDPDPRFDISNSATVHMESSAPAPLVTGGSVASGTVLSAFQTNTLMLKLVLGASWCLRPPGAVAFADGCAW